MKVKEKVKLWGRYKCAEHAVDFRCHICKSLYHKALDELHFYEMNEVGIPSHKKKEYFVYFDCPKHGMFYKTTMKCLCIK